MFSRGCRRHKHTFNEKNTDSHFNIYLGGTRSAQAQQIPVSMCFAETVQARIVHKSTDYSNVIHNIPRPQALTSFNVMR